MEMTIGGWAFMLLSWTMIISICAYSYGKLFSKNTKIIITKRAVMRHIWVERAVLHNIKFDGKPNYSALLEAGISRNEIDHAMETLLKSKKIRTIMDYLPFGKKNGNN
jgi:hypothetical protein